MLGFLYSPKNVIIRNGIVILRGSKPLKFETDTLEPNTEYRSLELSSDGRKEILVYGIVFDGDKFNELFKYID